MATIVTKFSQGDTVYLAGTATEKKRHPCPDCLGQKRWSATSPAGAEYTFDCPRCSASYHSERDLSLDYTAATPSVRRLTIGSVQYNTAHGSYDFGARYMCVETGVGSGSVYEEVKLFNTEAEAMASAEAMAAEQNATAPWIVKQYDKALKIRDYQLHNALIEEARKHRLATSAMIWNIGDLFEKIGEASSKDEILEAVDDYKSYDWQRDLEKISPSSNQEQAA